MKKKLFLTVLFLVLQIVPFNMLGNSSAIIKCSAAELSNIQPYSEDVGYIIRKINGRLYKRLWSYKQNKWLEPEWTPVP